MVLGEPGFVIANAMTSPAVNEAFASRIACRSEPGPLLFVLSTVNVAPGVVITARTFDANSEVLPNGSVAVALMSRPVSGVTGKETANATLPPASVVRFVEPSQNCPSPQPELSELRLA